MVVFNITSADFVLISADVVLKITKILKEMRIALLPSQNEQALFPKLERKRRKVTNLSNAYLHIAYAGV